MKDIISSPPSLTLPLKGGRDWGCGYCENAALSQCPSLPLEGGGLGGGWRLLYGAKS